MQNDDKRTSGIGASDARPPDDGLILRIAEGDTAALEVLYRQTSASVYGFALSILRDPTAAEDVMQDTFVSVMQSASSYQPSGKPMAWLRSPVRSYSVMSRRASCSLYGSHSRTRSMMPSASCSRPLCSYMSAAFISSWFFRFS